MTDAKHTQGPAKVQYETEVYVSVSNHGDVFICDCNEGEGEILIPERKANAALIAETFNIAHETGMKPRQLVNHLKNARDNYHRAADDFMLFGLTHTASNASVSSLGNPAR